MDSRCQRCHVRALLACLLISSSAFSSSACSSWVTAAERPTTQAPQAESMEPAAVADLMLLEVADPRSGGDATVFETGVSAFERPLPLLTNLQRRAFHVGNSFFNDAWVIAPASAAGRDGLGPLFNAVSCSGCHHLDGRGRPPERPEDPLESMLVRLSVVDATGRSWPHPVYGDQFQDKAIPGVPAEGRVRIDWEEIPGVYPDGAAYSLRRPQVQLTDLGYGPLGDHVRLSLRTAPAVFGVGLLEAIPDEAILAAADPDDRDGDGIRGRVRLVIEPRSGERRLGRFGWKAGAATIEQQTADAFAGDLGITTSFHPRDHATPTQVAAYLAAHQAANGGDPELSDHKLERVVAYQRMLAVPARRQVNDPRVRRGEALFRHLRCDACHTPGLYTGYVADFPALSHQRIQPFTDLLLHDMGDELADHRPEGDAPDGATGREWRTPPLWGLGLISVVNRHQLLLHDGRARGVEEAILWHGGTAAANRDAFRHLSADDRAAVVNFLNSL